MSFMIRQLSVIILGLKIIFLILKYYECKNYNYSSINSVDFM